MLVKKKIFNTLENLKKILYKWTKKNLKRVLYIIRDGGGTKFLCENWSNAFFLYTNSYLLIKKY
jgi:hypothetical protein